nr:integrase core domain-containing protein [Leptospira interrogans]
MKSNTKSFYHLTFSSCITDFRTPLSTLRVGSAWIGIKHKKTTRYSPWQNCYAERWIKTCRNEFLDFFIPINQYHLEKNLTEFVHFYNHHRTHLALNKDSPVSSPVLKPPPGAKLGATPIIGGSYHTYSYNKAA